MLWLAEQHPVLELQPHTPPSSAFVHISLLSAEDCGRGKGNVLIVFCGGGGLEEQLLAANIFTFIFISLSLYIILHTHIHMVLLSLW